LGRSSADGAAVAPLAEPIEEARPLFAFVSAFVPPDATAGWGARADDRLVGAVLLQRAGSAVMLHGPVVALGGAAEGEPTVMDNAAASASEPAEAPAEAMRLSADDPAETDRLQAAEDAFAVADRLLAEVLAHAPAQGIQTVFARPQGLDRIWVRAGFIPLPEVELPAALRSCPGVGLFGWRGGTAIWSAAGRAAAAAVTAGDSAGGKRPGGRGGPRRPGR